MSGPQGYHNCGGGTPADEAGSDMEVASHFAAWQNP
jgi:hypothetical protein